MFLLKGIENTYQKICEYFKILTLLCLPPHPVYCNKKYPSSQYVQLSSSKSLKSLILKIWMIETNDLILFLDD